MLYVCVRKFDVTGTVETFFWEENWPQEVPAELSPRASGQISRAYVSAVLYCVRYQLPLYCQVPTAPGRGRSSCAYGRTYGRAWHMPGGGARGRWTLVRDATPRRSAGAEQSQKFRDPHPKGYTTNWRGIAPWWSNEGKGRTRRTAVCWQARTWPTIDLQVNK